MPKKLNPHPGVHVEMVRKRLHDYRQHYGDIARCTGISFGWINRFAQGVIIDPGAARIETLARAIGYEVTYTEAPPAFKPKQRHIDDAAISRTINAQVYGEHAP